ncbi:unnamed protein product [Urochloa decumbens]|uniref:DUF6598 domain-containing protein n=1 Tax=Urochloa decumbens TaxID=240449 RepID=A0ABC8WZT7_9POAL
MPEEEHPVVASQAPGGGGATLPRTGMENDAAEEMQRPIKRPAEDDAEGLDAKRPKPPPSPIKWWEDKATTLLIGVRQEQATLYDPKRRSFHCCRGFERDVCEPAVFDHEEESTARIARPLDTIPDSKLDQLRLALNVIHVKVLASDVGFPVRVYGTVLMRDGLDFKCIYLFQRDRDNCQVISSPGEMLALTGPNRGPFEATTFYFEINLKIRGEEQIMDRIFCRTLIGQDYPLDQWTKKKQISSWLSTLEFAYRSVHYAVEATVGISILRGPRKFYGSLVACTSEDSNEMVLYDSERWGAVATYAADGSVALIRPLVVLREDEDLVLKVSSFGRGRRAKPKTNVLTVEHGDRSFNIRQGRYKLQVTISWSGILW